MAEFYGMLFCIKIDTMRNVVNKSANWIICFLICLCLAGCARSSETGENSNTEYILSYAENQPEGHPSTKAARYFADLVEERTEDRIRVEVYPEGKLGGELSAIHQVSYGGMILPGFPWRLWQKMDLTLRF